MYHFWNLYIQSCTLEIKISLTGPPSYIQCMAKLNVLLLKKMLNEWFWFCVIWMYSSRKYPLTSPIKDIFSKTPQSQKRQQKWDISHAKITLKWLLSKLNLLTWSVAILMWILKDLSIWSCWKDYMLTDYWILQVLPMGSPGVLAL